MNNVENDPFPETDTSEDDQETEHAEGDEVGLMDDRWKPKRKMSPTRLWKELPPHKKTQTVRRLGPPWKKQGNPPLQDRSSTTGPRPPRSPPPTRSTPKPKARPEHCRPKPKEDDNTGAQQEELETVRVEGDAEELSTEDALAIWQSLLEMAGDEDFNVNAPTLPPHMADNIVETLVDRPESQHNMLADTLPLFLSRVHKDLARALSRARRLRETMSTAAGSRDRDDGDGAEPEPVELEEDSGDCLMMQTTIKQSIDAMASTEDHLLSQLHRALQDLEPAVASSRALRLADQLANHDGFLAVDRALLEALLVAANEVTPPGPQGDHLLLEHEWCSVWWRRLRGLPEVDERDIDAELAIIDNHVAEQEQLNRDAEEAHEAAMEAQYFRGLEEAVEQHQERLKAQAEQEADDKALQTAMGFSHGRPTKRLCVGVCVTNGASTKAYDFEIDADHPVQIHIKAEAKEWAGKWYKAGREVHAREIPDEVRETLTSSSSTDPQPRKKRYDISKPATRNLFSQWEHGELSPQTVVTIGGVGLLTYFEALADIPEEVWQDLERRDTMNLEPAHSTVPQASTTSTCPQDATLTSLNVTATVPSHSSDTDVHVQGPTPEGNAGSRREAVNPDDVETVPLEDLE